MHLIIDADPIVYRAGFAAETHNYHLVVEHANGELEEKFFAKTEESSAGDKMKAWLKENEVEVLDKEMVPDVEPLNFALRGVKMTIDAVISDVTREYGKPTVVTVLLSGPGNFREAIATIKPYKGNRDSAYKPVHYQEIRDYLVHVHGGKVIEGHEADDECSILAHMEEGPCVVATIDKDLDQIPVPHYDYAKKVFYEVDEDEGQYIFWKQTLTGDATDNIQGLYRVGDKAAEKLLEKWIAEHAKQERDVPIENWIWSNTLVEYHENMKKYPDKYPEGMTPSEAALENARLVFMQHHRGQLWTPPGEPDEVTT